MKNKNGKELCILHSEEIRRFSFLNPAKQLLATFINEELVSLETRNSDYDLFDKIGDSDLPDLSDSVSELIPVMDALSEESSDCVVVAYLSVSDSEARSKEYHLDMGVVSASGYLFHLNTNKIYAPVNVSEWGES